MSIPVQKDFLDDGESKLQVLDVQRAHGVPIVVTESDSRKNLMSSVDIVVR